VEGIGLEGGGLLAAGWADGLVRSGKIDLSWLHEGCGETKECVRTRAQRDWGLENADKRLVNEGVEIQIM